MVIIQNVPESSRASWSSAGRRNVYVLQPASDTHAEGSPPSVSTLRSPRSFQLGADQSGSWRETSQPTSPESCCANKGLFVCLCSPEQLGRAELPVSPAAPEDRAVLESSPDRAGVSWVWQPRLLVLRSRCFSNKRAQSSLMERFGEGGLDLLIRRCLLAGLGWLSCSGESFLLRLAASGAGSANREDLLLIMLHPSKGGSSSPGDVPSLQLHFVQLQVCSICSVLQLFSSDSPLFFPNRAVPCSHFTSLFHVPLLNLWCLFWDFWCDSL